MADPQRLARRNEAEEENSRKGHFLESQLVLFVMLIFFISLLVFVRLYAAPQNRTLVLTGHPGELSVKEIDGRYYVDVEELMRLANGSLSFRRNQIVLTLSAPPITAPTSNSAANQSTASGFSREFLRAAIEEMSIIREWRSSLINAIRQGNPVTEDWVATFRGQAQQNLRLVSVAASNESDRNALQLLTNEFNNIKKLSDRFVEANKSRTYVSPNALDNDPLDRKILSCAHSLAAMAANNQFVDDGSCQ